MKTCLYFVVASVMVLGLAAQNAAARGGHGGGHGGGHRGGGHGGAHHAPEHHGGQHPGEHKGNSNHADQHRQQNNHHVDHHGNRPFTPNWYTHHPNAWNHDHPYWNGWTAASLGAAAGWLGATAWDDATEYPTNTTTVYTSDPSPDEVDDEDEDLDEADADRPSDAKQVALAAGLATRGTAEPGADAAFLPLGVYSLFPNGQDDANAMVQLAVSKQGVLRGSFYDLASEQSQAIQGFVDKSTQRAAFRVVPGGKALFETTLVDLTRPQGRISVHSDNGRTRLWTVEREEQGQQQEQPKTEVDAELIDE